MTGQIRFRRLTFLTILALSLKLATFCGAEEGKTALAKYSGSEPIKIASDRLEGDDRAGYAKFIGNVVAEQGNATIYADEITIYYQTGDQREIEKIVAVHGVRIIQGERIATGDKAVFFNREGKIVLTGSPKVHQGQDSVQGDEITVFLNEERSLVTGKEGGRVNAVFHPKEGTR